jgi:hypothetical protein
MKPVEHLTLDEIRAIRYNLDENTQFIEYIAERLQDIAFKLRLDYVPPTHDPNCHTCIITGAMEALENRMNRVRLGASVIYRSRTGSYDCAAIITATVKSLNKENVAAGYLPGLTSDFHVHLTVFTPGKIGQGRTETEAPFLTESPHGRSPNTGGTYQEWDIAFDAAGGPGTWRWEE